ncbi:hypothetical protein [uncultured Modestobacter sp.]|uniref:hypothetical protein n=1 Tax=uncultured Modestobacter sp. TaxID=380048 RepID=UPI002617A4DB|nr:hypothetical protein [uncultured Modestobacter sp.]
MSRRVNRAENNLTRPLSRAEREYLEAHLAGMPEQRADAFRALQDTPGGRARLRDAGYASRPREIEQRPQPVVGHLAGQPVNLSALVAGMRKTERGQAALRARGLL